MNFGPMDKAGRWTWIGLAIGVLVLIGLIWLLQL
jgi:hypothetical protein